MPILVKVNCELNGSFELRMYPCSECNVLLMKPARWKNVNNYQRRRRRKKKKNYNPRWCSVHPVLQPVTLLLTSTLGNAGHVAHITSGSCDVLSIDLLTLNLMFPQWVADVSFVRVACGHIIENYFSFRIKSPIRRMSRGGLSGIVWIIGCRVAWGTWSIVSGQHAPTLEKKDQQH